MSTKTTTRKQTPYVVHGVTFESHAAFIAARRRYRRSIRAEMKRGEHS